MGNFSRDTFDKLKHYVGVRLQQGALVVDADLNEGFGICKEELQDFIKEFVGNGVPAGNNGFKILHSYEENNFIISNGCCLVNGWEVRNEADIKYTEQPLYNDPDLADEWGVAPIGKLYPPLSIAIQKKEAAAASPIETKPPLQPEGRMDTVYLDVWEREVDATEDDELINPAIGIETCVRLKREWAVRVAQGQTTLSDPPEGHAYYPLAELKRRAGVNIIAGKAITDRRRTGLSMDHLQDRIESHNHSKLVAPDGSPDPALVVDNQGNVGIGTTNPAAKLDVNGIIKGGGLNIDDNFTATIGCADFKMGHSTRRGSPGRALVDTGDALIVNYGADWPKCAVMGNVGIGTDAPDAQLSLGKLNSGESGPTGDGATQLLLSGRMNTGVNLGSTNGTYKLRIEGYNNDGPTVYPIYCIDENNMVDFWIKNRPAQNKLPTMFFAGKVGIGTTEPGAKLHINGGLKMNIGEGLEFLGEPNYFGTYLDARIIRMIDTNGGNGLVDGGIAIEGYTALDEIRKPIMVIRGNGNVGIGTTSPSSKLHIKSGVTTSLTLTGAGKSYTNAEIVLEATDDDANYRGLGLFMHDKVGKTEWYAGKPYVSADQYQIGRAAGITSHSRATAITSNAFFTIKKNGNVGIGTMNPGDHKLDVRGRCYSSGGWETTNADYAEYLESVDGSPIPDGTSVVLTENGKIKPSEKEESPIGIVSRNSAILGNSYKEWPKKYLRDDFGSVIEEEYKEERITPKKEKVKKERQKVEKKIVEETVTRMEIVKVKGKYCQKEISKTVEKEVEEPVFKEVDLYDAAGKNKIGKHQVPLMETYEEEIDVLDDNGQPVMTGSGKFETETRPKINPEYDETIEYISREIRPEWNCVGLLGQLPMRKGQPTAPTWVKIKDISKDVELWLVK